MARIRYIKPDFFKDEDIANLPDKIRLFYIGLWVQADKEGRLEDRPKRLKVEILPYDNYKIEKALELLAQPKSTTKRPFIIRYEVSGERYIQIVHWKKHQRPHHTEKESEIPPPSNGDLTVKEPLDNSKELLQLTRNGEGEGKGNGEEQALASPHLNNSSFKEIWGAWLEVRKKARVPNTSRALQLALNKLNKHPADTAVKMLEKAVEGGWKSVYELKETKPQRKIF